MHFPQVDKILREPSLEALARTVRRDIIAQAVRQEIEWLREKAAVGIVPEQEYSAQAIAAAAQANLQNLLKGGIRRVINGTGVILSTNLGRAPLAAASAARLAEALSSYCNLEFDLETGERGERTSHLSLLLKLLTGSQSAIVVNNCASAVMLAVQALARGKEVIVSRGELIEIGGSFRLPDVITASGGLLKEVGTTNRTRLSDYKKAISSNTGLLIKCHRSNFQIVGFTEETSTEELAALAKEKQIPLVYDLGGGCLVDLDKYDLAVEPTVQATLSAGVDLVMFSGDKLLGGPQAGIIAGKKTFVSQLRSSPVYRALRADKLVLAVLETVLAQYLNVNGADSLPVFSLAARKVEQIKERTDLFIGRIKEQLNAIEITGAAMTSTMGGGSLPGETLPSHGITLKVKGKKIKETQLAKRLREADPPVISTISSGLVMLDFRTIKEEEEKMLLGILLDIDRSLQ